jgi:Polyketide cyclase / dehydrase and lipid transport
MPEIKLQVVIERPAPIVFDFATTPKNWPRIWPVTLSVSGDIEVSPKPGAKWTEQVRLLIWRGELLWQAVDTNPPHRFVMGNTMRGFGFLGFLTRGTTGQITYALSESNGTTTLTRVLEYQVPGLIGKVVDTFFIRWLVTRIARKALAILKRTLESPACRNGAA